MFVEQVADYAIFMLDPAGYVRSWNAGAARLKGYDEDEILGEHFSRFFTAEARAAGRPNHLLARAAAAGRVEDEGWRVRKDGSRFWANVVLTAVHDEHGGLRGFAKITRDVTEQRRLAFTGKASAILLSSLDCDQTLSQVAELCVPFLADWASVHLISEGEPRTLSIHHSDPARQSLIAGLDRAALPARSATLARVLATGEAELIPEITDASLSAASVDPAHRAILDALGLRSAILVPMKIGDTVFGVLTLASAESGRRYDQGDLKFARELGARCAQAIDNARAHTQVQVDRQFLRAVVSGMREGVVVREAPSGKLLLANDQAGRILKERSSDEDALFFRVFLDEAGKPIPRKDGPLQRALRHGDISSDVEMSFVEGGETTTISVSAAPVRDESGRILGAVATFRDITAHKQRQKSLEEDVALREMFFGIVGHDLRSPLAAIVSAASLLLRRGVPEEHARVVRRIALSADRMKGMVADLLDLTRARLAGGIPISPRPTDVAEICRSVISEVGTAHPECPVSLTSEGNVRAAVDPDRMAQVVSNLLSNAVRFGCDAQISVRLRSTGDGVEFEVHNEGDPIPSELLPIVFDPFRRAASQRETQAGGGLGLGLFIVREIVEGHRGRIEVTSNREEGTTFRVWIPRDPATVPGPRTSGPGMGHAFRMRPTDRSDSLGALLLH